MARDNVEASELNSSKQFDCDYLIVGSGFGGAVSACRLNEKGYDVVVLEQGRRWTPDTLPATNWKFWDYLWGPALRLRGFMNIALFKHVLILHGNAVGGGSITYADIAGAAGIGLERRRMGRSGRLADGHARSLRDGKAHAGREP